MTQVFLAGDSGPSGFGVPTRNFVLRLLDEPSIDLTYRTHQWGFNREGMQFEREFPDTRFKERLLREDEVNDDYLIDYQHELQDREDTFMEDIGTNQTAPSHGCMIRNFEGKEDVWLAIGGVEFAEQAPDDDDIRTIVSVDYNLDIVPRNWEYYLKDVDEIWVPSQWTKEAITDRVPSFEDKTYVLPYGIDRRHRPTEYDCEVCPNDAHRTPTPQDDQCLRDDKFTFLVTSRFYHIKGVARTVEAFAREFSADEDVRLFFKTTSNNQFDFDPGQSIQQLVHQELQMNRPPEIGMGTAFLNSQKMHDLYGHVDAFVQASRAECFGLAQLQALWTGTPVIGTNWSAQQEVLPGSAFLVDDYEVTQPHHEYDMFVYEKGTEYPPDAQWAEPSIDALRKKMRTVFELSEEERREIGADGRAFVEEQYDWEDRAAQRVRRLNA